ncbi:Uncharacterised protein [Mycobacteroides abscessus subsp. bolletii]|uniref:hypothetical protein n=3 Tax=Mycobacteroides abscessus TaxID=36809 RepID=UPI000929087C|nr:hypothetical protein [Mycobacteroides abscessus]SHP73758.1 Uncharacterised protein [Mycobacteroides abscessus subsp. bolletii]SHR30966.1 Uncharacterised protein [Mycobacteroides abscessus subsp. abscessus]SHS01742.1 Uncharacterised protein [Mycobacteroides abscessus subsp. bolletii]SHS35068.1 Uncharacterised protein [Mycobacteroides abscessus subsp. bolletii]SHX91081.1 Uncharacterised protein [Mycobacteroides abscessus subsp. bolletii]
MNAGKLYRAPRRWPAVVAAASAGVLVGAVIGAGTTILTRERATAAAVTATATSEPSVPPTAMSPERANRQTCEGWDTAGKLINEAADALTVIPEGTSILDPAVRNTPERVSAVMHAGDLFQQAADALKQRITPGATEILTLTSQTTVGSLAALASAYRSFDESSGDSITTARAAAHSMSALCKRLVS